MISDINLDLAMVTHVSGLTLTMVSIWECSLPDPEHKLHRCDKPLLHTWCHYSPQCLLLFDQRIGGLIDVE